jgi:hypothetical protein
MEQIVNPEKNFEEYKNEPLRIGFTDKFPEVRTIDEMMVDSTCRGFAVRFSVRLVKVAFEKGGREVCDGVVTDSVDIAHKLRAGGFGSHCYVEEAQTMEGAVVEMCKKHNLMICSKVCSWPFAVAIVQVNEKPNRAKVCEASEEAEKQRKNGHYRTKAKAFNIV